jgi:transcriptional regulator with AAA-type ATPase domain
MNEGSNKNDHDKNDLSIDSTKVKYIIPPGLHKAFEEFVVHCEIAQDQPMIIVGGTGVGKSMFLDVFKKIYEERCKEKKKKPNVVWANCAHFGTDYNDSSLARSELFGYVEGAFTGAKKGGMEGLIQKANKGLLILEEIGELPRPVQAMLLRFIETGEYNKVGDPETKVAEVQVIGATNNEKDLREDFRHRFIPFYVPALHERRKDVLYYIAYKFPELIQTLNSSEILALLTYHWPGNVREVDRTARVMLRKTLVSDKSYIRGKGREGGNVYNRLSENQIKSVNSNQVLEIMDWASSWGGDEFLESHLEEYGLDLSLPGTHNIFPFRDLDGPTVINLISTHDIEDETKALLARFELKNVSKIKEFDRAYEGFLAFCGLFGQNASKDKNILSDLKNGETYSLTWGWHDRPFSDLKDGLNDSLSNGKQYYRCAKSVQIGNVLAWRMHFHRDIKSEYFENNLSELKNVIPEEAYEFWSRLGEQVNSDILKDSRHELENQKNPDKQPHGENGQNCIDVSEMTEAQLLKKYYEIRLRITGGNVKKAARQADVPNTTLRDRLDKLGVPFRREDKNI